MLTVDKLNKLARMVDRGEYVVRIHIKTSDDVPNEGYIVDEVDVDVDYLYYTDGESLGCVKASLVDLSDLVFYKKEPVPAELL